MQHTCGDLEVLCDGAAQRENAGDVFSDIHLHKVLTSTVGTDIARVRAGNRS
jgi:hypothetical protein